KRLASAGRDNAARVWEAATGKELCAMAGHAGPVHHLAFSPDGRRLVTAGDDRAAAVWDAATGRRLFTLRGHAAPVHAVTFGSNGRRLITVAADDTVKVWEATHGGQGLHLPGRLTGLAFCPDRRTVATVSTEEAGAVKLWDVGTGREVATLRGLEGQVKR